MDAAQLAELEERLDRIEQVLEKPANWWECNFPLLLQTVVLIITFTVAWVRMEMKIVSIQDTDLRMQDQIKMESSAIRTHHEDIVRHVDASWKAEIRSDLNAIRNLLIEHMSDGKRTK